MNEKQMKFENPKRLKELNPEDTLLRIGMKDNYSLCDIGAGTGVFSVPASRMTHNTVYALEISDEMLEIIAEKIEKEKIENIKLVKVKDNQFDVLDSTIDIALMVTVLHEIENKSEIIKEIDRVLKKSGSICVIEFHKPETHGGSPMKPRISKSEVISMMSHFGYVLNKEFDLGSNLYCVLLRRDI